MKKDYSMLSTSIKKIMDKTFLTVKKNQRVSDAHNLLKKKPNLFEIMDYIYVVQDNDELIGVFSIKELFRHPSNVQVEKFMIKKVITAPSSAETERVARIALKNEIKAVPIIEGKRIIGVVSSKNILKILDRSLRKDLLNIAGIHRAHLEYENAIDVPLVKSVAHRMPWLIGGLMGMLAVAAFIGVFENTLKENLILASFIPVIVYICGALCTQIETLLVRDLAVMGNELKIWKYMIKQGMISGMISLMIGALLFLVINSFWGEKQIAYVISIAAIISLVLTTLTSFIIILGIKKLGGDPALGGGPFGTVVSDSLSIIIFILVSNSLL